jgi:hypothetical protein
MLRSILRRRAGGSDSGVALVVVIGLTAVMLLVVATALTGASSGLRQANSAQSSARALDAAYAGVQDYIAKLNADSTYPQYGNKTAAFSAKSKVTLPAASNPAFGVAPGDTWATLPGATTAATFRYEVDNSLYGTSGLLRLRSTGRYGPFTKTIVASIQQQGFINYLYFTNYETIDPQISKSGATCNRYLWATPSRNTSSSACPTISFAAQDLLEGPVRSNDTITVCGARFNGAVTTGNPGTPRIATTSGCSQTATYATPAAYAPVLSLPATNTSMKAQTYSDTATNPGCLYTGPTQITLKSDGTMTVVSPWTEATAVKANGTAAANPAPSACGALSDLHSTKGATVPVPANNLVFVQGVPNITTDPNYTPSIAPTTPTSAPCGPAYLTTYTAQCIMSNGTACNQGQYNKGACTVIVDTSIPDGAVPSSVTQAKWNSNTSYTCTDANAASMPTTTSSGSAGWIFKDSDGTVRFPLAGESPATDWDNSTKTAWDTTTPAYGCRNGDAFVSGTLSGQLTIASDNYVYATGDVRYQDPTGDVLGLVGNNGVLVWNPMASAVPMLPAKNREIDAAILSPAHTFMVQNRDIGPYRGVLTIKGSIAQNYRGSVATSVNGSVVTGYSKDYGYDSRFITVTPPYYLKPTSASFKVSAYASTAIAFDSTGTAR